MGRVHGLVLYIEMSYHFLEVFELTNALSIYLKSSFTPTSLLSSAFEVEI